MSRRDRVTHFGRLPARGASAIMAAKGRVPKSIKLRKGKTLEDIKRQKVRIQRRIFDSNTSAFLRREHLRPELRIPADGLGDDWRVASGHVEHLGGHVHSDDAPSGPDRLRGDEADLAAAAAQVEDRLALAQVLARVAAAVVALEDLRGDRLEVAGVVVHRTAQRLFAGLAPPSLVIKEVAKMFRPPQRN